MTAPETSHGRRALIEHANFLGLGAVLLVPHNPESVGAVTIGRMPSGFSSKGTDGRTLPSGLTGASPLYPEMLDPTVLLALAFAGPALRHDNLGGTGSHSERDKSGLITVDLMSSDPPALAERIGTICLVWKKGWEENRNHDFAPTRPAMGYRHPGDGEVRVLDTVTVGFDDLLGPVRYHPDPPTAHFPES